MILQNANLTRTLFQRGFSAHNAGNIDAAAALYAQVLALEPRHFDALHLSGVIALQKGDPAKAVDFIGKAIKADKKQQAAFSNRAAAYLALDNPKAALADLDQAVALSPNQPEAHYNRAKALMALSRADEALKAFDRALALNPRYVDAHVTRGTLFAEQGDHTEALACAERALALDDRKFEAHFNRAHALAALGQEAAAIAGYTAALALQPAHVQALNNRGNVQQHLNRYELALADYVRAAEIDPAYPRSYVNGALCLFALGRFAEAWPVYEWRFQTPELAPIVQGVQEPRWNGEPLAGKSILLLGEQGLGDILHFSRYAPILAGMGAEVRLKVPASLAGLLSGLDGVAAVSDETPQPAADFYCPLLSVPLALGATTIPNEPYLRADPEKASAWAARLAGQAGLKIGLVWAGSAQKNLPSTLSMGALRSLPVTAFAPLARFKGITWVSLQKGEQRDELALAQAAGWGGPEILDMTDDIKDFADTAALVANLDLVISCDTSVVHLAGGMGKPVWILNRAHGCWRYPVGRDDSPWYPTARVFHQAIPGDWDGVIAAVVGALEAFTPSPSPPG